MYEFSVPQPSAFHNLALKEVKSNVNETIINKPVDPKTLGYDNYLKIDEFNYHTLATTYKAKVTPFLKPISISKTKVDSQWGDNDGRARRISGMDIAIPKNYKVDLVTGYIRLQNGDHPATWGNMNGQIQIGTKVLSIYNRTNFYNLNVTFTDEICDNLSMILTTWDIGIFNYDVIVKCSMNQNAKENWQIETYDAIIAGYTEQLRLYNESIAVAKSEGVKMLDSNPLFYREIEQTVLRKNCISYLLNDAPNSDRRFGQKMYNGTSFKNFQLNVDQKMDNYTSFAKFMEQAFEWNLMSYNFYPFYWGNKDDWDNLYQFESNDKIFRSFMQAGLARVIVTVKPGFENAVMHYMKFGQIWNGGQTPILGDPLYLSIVDELKEQEYTVEETWETVLPTQLIGLQEGGVSVQGSGLPCDEGCEQHGGKKLINNTNTLGQAATK